MKKEEEKKNKTQSTKSNTTQTATMRIERKATKVKCLQHNQKTGGCVWVKVKGTNHANI